ncbi:MAG TPA: pyridoxamine 5'-phosphate oxidase family protein [Actinomycetota bacterium]|nr:pyridoxamine 5'-phosphate oxidase family protein [Actinomycetota bacterium]
MPTGPLAVVNEARRAVMSTTAADGSPHSVPITYAIRGNSFITPIDHKPKRGVKLARVKNIERDGRVTLLIDRWDEDWSRLAWVMVKGRAHLELDPAMPPELIERYEQFVGQSEDALIVIEPYRILWWSWS